MRERGLSGIQPLRGPPVGVASVARALAARQPSYLSPLPPLLTSLSPPIKPLAQECFLGTCTHSHPLPWGPQGLPRTPPACCVDAGVRALLIVQPPPQGLAPPASASKRLTVLPPSSRWTFPGSLPLTLILVSLLVTCPELSFSLSVLCCLWAFLFCKSSQEEAPGSTEVGEGLVSGSPSKRPALPRQRVCSYCVGDIASTQRSLFLAEHRRLLSPPVGTLPRALTHEGVHAVCPCKGHCNLGT